eukprot:COSAG01_NODE_1775_length_9260_cov_58.468784_9_plen_78_part_00
MPSQVHLGVALGLSLTVLWGAVIIYYYVLDRRTSAAAGKHKQVQACADPIRLRVLVCATVRQTHHIPAVWGSWLSAE